MTAAARPLRLLNKVVSVKTVSAPAFLCPEVSKATQPAAFGVRPFRRVRCTRPSRSIMAEAYPTIDSNGNIQRQTSCSALTTPGAAAAATAAAAELPTTTYQSTQYLQQHSSRQSVDDPVDLKLCSSKGAKHSRPTSTQISEIYYSNNENQGQEILYSSAG